VDDDDEDFFAEFNVGADDLDDDAPAAAKKAPAKPTFSNTGSDPATPLLLLALDTAYMDMLLQLKWHTMITAACRKGDTWEHVGLTCRTA
jgi:hypothetical protein